MARTRSASLVALRQVWAVAQLTIGEAVRSRFLLAVVLLGLVALLYAAQAQAVGEMDRAMLLRQNLLQLVGAIVVVATMFVAAFTIPNDIESRRIFTLVTKPVSRGAVVFGRFLGVALLALVVLIVLGGLAASVMTITLGGETAEEVAPRARVLPSEVALWGEAETRLTREAADGSRELVDPHHAGVLARFVIQEPEAFDEEGPLLRIRTRLRMLPGRMVYPHERAELSAAPRGAGSEEVWRTSIPVRRNEPVEVRIPWQAFGPAEAEAEHGPWLAEVALTAEGLPFTMVIAPDSMQLLGRAQPHAAGFFLMLTVEAVKVLFVLAVVVALACVFSPYTSILGGLFTVLAANLVGHVPSTVAGLATQLEHARAREYMDPSLAVIAGVMGDPAAEGVNAWTFVLAFAEIFPAFDRYPLTANYVAGIMPEPGYLLASTAYLLFWSVLLLAGGAMLFTLRDYP